MDKSGILYIYGPVLSRRLGFSLGIDLFASLGKTCNFNCIYCQLGKTNKKTAKRFYCIDLERLKKELKETINKTQDIDYISISGSGEPTLHKDLDKIVSEIKKITGYKYPVCLITNSSLLYRKDLVKELKEIDLIIPSLDAAREQTFKKINRANVNLKKIIKGLINLRKEFRGKIWLEIMLIGGLNDTKEEIEEFKKIIEKIKPDKIHLNLPIRPTADKIKFPGKKNLNLFKKILGKNVEVVSYPDKELREKYSESIREVITNYLRRRPATLEDFEKIFDIGKKIILENLKELIKEKKIESKVYNRKKYFVIKND